MLSIKGREPFIRMQLWLNDPHNIEKLQTLKNERREATKRRRGLDPQLDISQDSYDMFQVPSPSGSSKKARVLFSDEQKEALRLAFALDSYPNLAAIEFLSQELQISTRTITNWFHNHRMRLKQQSGSPDGFVSSPPRESSVTHPQTPSQISFDPLHFRVMLSQRLMELRKEKGLPPTIPGLGSGLPSNIHPSFFSPMPPFSIANLNLVNSDRYSAGLDLSMKNEHENDSVVSYVDEDSNISGGLSPVANRSDCEEYSEDQYGQASSPAAGSSRRKPSVPQWVNPSWATVPSDKEREVIINGVCVMQTNDYRANSEQETVLIEPISVEDARKSATSNVECRNSPEKLEEMASSSDVDIVVSPSEKSSEIPALREEQNDQQIFCSSDSQYCDVNGGPHYQQSPGSSSEKQELKESSDGEDV